MTKIAILGAGSAGFARQRITDGLATDGLPALDPLTAAVSSLCGR